MTRVNMEVIAPVDIFIRFLNFGPKSKRCQHSMALSNWHQAGVFKPGTLTTYHTSKKFIFLFPKFYQLTSCLLLICRPTKPGLITFFISWKRRKKFSGNWRSKGSSVTKILGTTIRPRGSNQEKRTRARNMNPEDGIGYDTIDQRRPSSETSIIIRLNLFASRADDFLITTFYSFLRILYEW